MWREKYQNDVLRYLTSYGVDETVAFSDMTDNLQEQDTDDPIRQQQIAVLASTQVLRTIAISYPQEPLLSPFNFIP